MKGIIIGAGISGLTAALSLAMKGIEFRIFEKSSTLEPNGYGILLAPNGMAILRKISPGLEDLIRDHGTTLQNIRIINHKKKGLLNINYVDCMKKIGLGSTAISSKKLFEILLNTMTTTLNNYPISLNKKCISVKQDHLGVIAIFEDGTEESGDFLIAADGIDSIIRPHITGKIKPTSTGILSWLGLVSIVLPQPFHEDLTEIWGKSPGSRIIFAQSGGRYTYLNATLGTPYDNQVEFPNLKEFLHETFNFAPPLFHEIIQKSNSEDLYQYDHYSIPVQKKWFKGRILLIGDSIHPIIPHLGLSENQCIESGFIVAHCLSKIKYNNTQQFENAFEEFHGIRRDRIQLVSEFALDVEKKMMMRNTFTNFIRNFTIRKNRSSILDSDIYKIFNLNF